MVHKTKKLHESGSSTVEYAVLVALLSVVVIGSLATLGKTSRNELCALSTNRGDFNSDGVVDDKDREIHRSNLSSARSNPNGDLDFASDLNCDNRLTIPGRDADNDWHRFLEFQD